MDDSLNNVISEKYLPVGTVVLLKGGKKRAAIIGFGCVDSSKKDKIYDYIGCLYPEGFISSNKNILFDHNQIDKVFFVGYSDDEDKEFKKRLNEILNK